MEARRRRGERDVGAVVVGVVGKAGEAGRLGGGGRRQRCCVPRYDGCCLALRWGLGARTWRVVPPRQDARCPWRLALMYARAAVRADVSDRRDRAPTPPRASRKPIRRPDNRGRGGCRTDGGTEGGGEGWEGGRAGAGEDSQRELAQTSTHTVAASCASRGWCVGPRRLSQREPARLPSRHSLRAVSFSTEVRAYETKVFTLGLAKGGGRGEGGPPCGQKGARPHANRGGTRRAASGVADATAGARLLRGARCARPPLRAGGRAGPAVAAGSSQQREQPTEGPPPGGAALGKSLAAGPARRVWQGSAATPPLRGITRGGGGLVGPPRVHRDHESNIQCLTRASSGVW